MSDLTGDATRRLLRTMPWADRRAVLVSARRHLADRPAGECSPFDQMLLGLVEDIFAAEDEERALAADVDGIG